jgi:hypothetical protein
VSLERELEQKRAEREEVDCALAEAIAAADELKKVERNSRIQFWLLVAAFVLMDAFFLYLFVQR